MSPPVILDTAPFWGRLSVYGDRPALVSDTDSVSYTELAERVSALAARLGPTRRLVVVEGGNTVDAVVAYLAGLSGGHATILVPSADAVASYDPDVVIRTGRLHVRRDGTAHDLHPDLALLLSTSGTTGSPKLVRLSGTNLSANAAAIASYLQIRPTDVAPTTLPMHYCYGLSVINSHLSVGAAVMLTEESVLAAGFWEAFRVTGCTTLSGVPYTFDLLDRVGFASMELPTLRYLTQAGGRLDPVTVRRYAQLGQQRGFDLFVMYGQTEATARMAYLPPDLTLSCAATIGVPVPGGAFTLSDEGELIYAGPNVMLGYAEGASDLARGPELTELRTGDLARLRPDGLYEITGRKSRFAKVFGLRIDLDRLEQLLAADGVLAQCADGGDRVVVAFDVSAKPAPPDLRDKAAAAAGLPATAVQVLPLTEVPRLPSGKPDYRSIVGSAGFPRDHGKPAPGGDLTDLFAEILRRDDVTPDDSFVSLKGDSLSYVEMSLRLERALGSLPADWQTTPIRVLAATERRSRRGRAVETNVLVRAMAIVMIVGSHSNLFALVGGAHVLVGLAGFNFARFHLNESPRVERVRHLAGSIVRIVVPSVLWLSFAAAASWKYGVLNVLLLNGILGTRAWSESWHYWFVEMLVYTLVALAVLLAIPAVDRWERRRPFALPMLLVAVGLLTRYGLVSLIGGDRIHRAHVIFWLFALGWAAAKATTVQQRLLVSAVLAVTVPGFFQDLHRELIVVVGLLLVVWLRSVRVPAALSRLAGVLASASLYIYLCHWQVYPYWEDTAPLVATLLSLSAGLAFWWVVTRVSPRAGRAVSEIRENLRWLNPRRCATHDSWTKQPAARPRGDDQPAHLAA